MLAHSVEKKDITIRSTGLILTSATASNAPVLLNGLAQGTSATTRIGRKVTLKSLFLRFEINLSLTAAATQPVQSSPIRIMAVYDRQTNAATPAVTDIVLTNEITSPNNLTNSSRFKVLFNEECPCLGTSGPSSWMVERYVPMDERMEFNTGTTGNVGDIATGGVFFVAWQDGNIVTTTGLTLNSILYTRIRFVDN